MKRLQASTPNAEVLGQGMNSFLQNIQSAEVAPVLAKHGLTVIEPEKWYPHQQMLDIYADIQAQEDLVAIGMRIVETAKFPPEIDSIEAALHAIPIGYNMNHRNHTERGWIIEVTGPGKAVATSESPYPDDLVYGLLWAQVKRFLPAGTRFTVRPTKPVFDGLEDAVYEVTWG